MDFAVPSLLTQIFRRTFLDQSPSDDGLKFPTEQWEVNLLSGPWKNGIQFWSTPALFFVLWTKTTSRTCIPHASLTMALPQRWLNMSFHPPHSPTPPRSTVSKVCWYRPDHPYTLWCRKILKTKQTKKAYLERFQVKLGDWKQKYHKYRTQLGWYLAGYLQRCFCLPCLRVAIYIALAGDRNTSLGHHVSQVWAKCWNLLRQVRKGVKVVSHLPLSINFEISITTIFFI